MIRAARPADFAAIRAILQQAFGGTAEADLLTGLRAGGHVLAELVAERDGEVAGHVMLSQMHPPGYVALGPLAVATVHRGQGIGGQLVGAGLAACRAAGVLAVILRGDPRYYARFGFSAVLARCIANRFAGPTLQATELLPGVLAAPIALRHAPPFDAL